MRNTAGLGAVLLIAMAGTAAAGPFVNIHRFDSASRAGGEMTYLDLEGPNDVTLLRFDLHAQYVDSSSNAGGYIQLPIGYASGDNDSETAMGNVEIGGIFVPRLSSQTMSIVLHGGLTLPTAEDSEVGVLAGLLRVHDLYQTLPKGTTVRLGVSPLFHSGQLYGRIDVGVDINIDNADDDNADPGIHFNVGGGMWVSREVALTLELSSLTVLDDTDNDDDNLVNGTFGARFYAGAVAPYVGLTVPLDDDINDFINLGVTIGVDARI